MQHGYRVNTKKALLCGYFGYGNLGDEEILISAIQKLKAHGISSYVMFNPRGEFDTYSKFGAKRVNRFSPKEIGSALDSVGALIFTGGNLFQNVTSERSLLYYTAVAALAKKRGLPVMMLSSGLGEVRGGLSRRYSSRILSEFSFAGLRTELDRREGARIFNCPTFNMPDLTFSSAVGRGAKRDYFVIIPKSYSKELITMARRLMSYGLLPVIIPFYIEEDAKFARKIGEELLCEVFFSRDIKEIRKRLSGARLTLTERLHGGIFSILSSTPAYMSSPSSKSRRFAYEVKRRSEKLNTPSPIIKKDDVFEFSNYRDLTDYSSLASLFARDIDICFGQAFTT